MRELVAPATRWLLRLALFLALLAWLQAHWWRVIAQWAPVGVALTQDGYAIVLGNGGVTEFEVHSADDQPRLDEFYFSPSTLLEDAKPTGFEFAGIAVNRYRDRATVTLVGVRHLTVVCLLVATLLAFRVVRNRFNDRGDGTSQTKTDRQTSAGESSSPFSAVDA
ncbi:MAG: hypothetical protein Fues2KO_20090 [Fuerstiella sp.]